MSFRVHIGVVPNMHGPLSALLSCWRFMNLHPPITTVVTFDNAGSRGEAEFLTIVCNLA